MSGMVPSLLPPSPVHLLLPKGITVTGTCTGLCTDPFGIILALLEVAMLCLQSNVFQKPAKRLHQSPRSALLTVCSADTSVCPSAHPWVSQQKNVVSHIMIFLEKCKSLDSHVHYDSRNGETGLADALMTLVKREESLGLYYSKESSLLAHYHCYHIDTCAFWLCTNLFNLVKVHK